MTTPPRAEPTVTRPEERADAYDAAHHAELARIIEEPLRARMERQARIADLTRRANEPLLRLIREDANAVAAYADLHNERIGSLGDGPVFTGGRSPTFALTSLHPGTNVLSKPWDYEIRAPSSPTARVTTSRVEGTFEYHLPAGEGGGRWATAGVGVTLRAGLTGTAHIRPSWRYELSFLASGSFFSAHSDGAAIAVAQDADTGAELMRREVWLWYADDNTLGNDQGYIDSWALALDVFVHEGQLFKVTLTGIGSVQDTSEILGIGSYASGFLSMTVPFIVVEL